MNPDALARGLGWLSIGLGVADVIGAGWLAETLGMKGHKRLFQAAGVREIATGVGCLTTNPPTTAVWSRIAGDACDIAALAPHLHRDNPKRRNVALGLATVAAVTLVDVVAGVWLCEGRDGPITRFVRRRVERREVENERKMNHRAARTRPRISPVDAANGAAMSK